MEKVHAHALYVASVQKMGNFFRVCVGRAALIGINGASMFGFIFHVFSSSPTGVTYVKSHTIPIDLTPNQNGRVETKM